MPRAASISSTIRRLSGKRNTARPVADNLGRKAVTGISGVVIRAGYPLPPATATYARNLMMPSTSPSVIQFCGGMVYGHGDASYQQPEIAKVSSSYVLMGTAILS